MQLAVSGWMIGIVAAVAITIGVAGFFVFRMLRAFKAVQSRYMPLGGKLAFWLSLVYTLSPVDFLPDPILIDDIGVLGLALMYINHLIKTNFPQDEIGPLEGDRAR